MHSRRLWLIAAFVVLVVTVLVGYRLLRPVQSHTMRHALSGYVLEVTPEVNRITVRNADIPGTMTSMVMDYRVRDAAALAADEIVKGHPRSSSYCGFDFFAASSVFSFSLAPRRILPIA